MSYGVSQPLQAAVYGALSADGPLAGLVGSEIFDMPPSGSVPELYVAIGPEEVSAKQDSSGSVTTHQMVISVVGRTGGFSALKAAAGAVSDCLDRATLPLSRGHLVSMDFHKARARKTAENRERQIDLWFRAIVEDS